jgi:hypothetical protein
MRDEERAFLVVVGRYRASARPQLRIAPSATPEYMWATLGAHRRGSCYFARVLGPIDSWMLVAAVAASQPSAGSVGRAREEAVELKWEAPARCPSHADAQLRLERALAERGASPADRASVDVQVTEKGSGRYELSMQVRLGDRIGRRTIEGEDCEALADVAALVVAIALDPGGDATFETLETQETEEAPVVVPQPDASAREDEAQAAVSPPAASADASIEPAAPPRPPVAARPRPSFFAQAGAGVGVGMLPSAGPSIALAFGPRGRHWMATLGGTFWFRREGRVPEHPEVGGELRLWSIDARGCGIPAIGIVAFPLCGGLGVGMLHGRGIGELQPRSARSAWVAIRVGPGLEVWPVRRFGLWVRAEGAFVVARPTFEVPNRGEVCCANIATLDAAVGVAVRLP